MLNYLIFIISYFLWILALLGYGTLFYHSKNVLKFSHTFFSGNCLSLLFYGIGGLIFITIITTLINFFIPINLIISTLLLTIGLMTFFINQKIILNGIDRTELLLLAALSALILILIPITWTNWYDTGLYHLPTIKWIIQNSVTFGLANLHGRFGFNCSWFMTSSVIDQWVIYFNIPFFLINGIMIFFYSSSIFLTVKRIFLAQKFSITNNQIICSDNYNEHILRPSDIFLFLSSIALVYPGLMFLSSPSPDLPIMILTLIVIFFFIKDIELGHTTSMYSVLAIILSLYAITVKLSAIALLMVLFVILCRMFRHYSHIVRSLDNCNNTVVLIMPSVKRITSLVGVSALIIAPWLIRGVMLSGCLFYPLLIGYFPSLKWAVPAQLARDEVAWTTGWARAPGPYALDSLTNWDWVYGWLICNFYINKWFNPPVPVNNLESLMNIVWWCVKNLTVLLLSPNSRLVLPFLLLLATFILIIYNLKRKSLTAQYSLKTYLMPLLLSVIGLSFWFYSAPDPRFGWGFIYSITFILLSLTIFIFLNSIPKTVIESTSLITKRIRKFSIILISLVILYCLFSVIYIVGIYACTDLSFPKTTLHMVKTNDGHTIYVPTKGDQCWDGPLPNTPYFNNTLRVEIPNATSSHWMFWYEDKNSSPYGVI